MQATLERDLDYDEGIYYPSSDGEPLAETPAHARCLVLLFQALEDFFRSRPDVYVAMNMNWYWERGNPKARRAPDVMVIPRIGHKVRNSIRSWNEGGAVPTVCFEMASKKTWKKSLGAVKADYEANGVKEYFIFDPRFQFLEEPLIGFRLQRGRYVQLASDLDGGMVSQQLNVCIVPEGEYLRLIDAVTGERVLTKDERIAKEEARADALATEVAQLKAQFRSAGKPANGAQ